MLRPGTGLSTVRLLIAYDGGAVRRLGGAAGPAHDRGRARRRAREDRRRTRAADGRRAHRRRRPRDGPGREPRSRPRAGGARTAPQRRCCPTRSSSGRPSRRDGFDARRDARSRVYRYRVLSAPTPSPFERGRALFWPHRLDRDALDACAAALPGAHDFTAFTPTETAHRRFEREVLRAEWIEEPLEPPHPGELLELWIEADSFMRHMVRVPRRHDARGRRAAGVRSRTSGGCSTARRAATRARRPSPTACIWPRCATSAAARRR